MTDFDPTPDPDAIDERREHRWAGIDTFGRVYETTLGLTESTTATDVASITDCSPNAAKKHLDRLTEMGIARADYESRPTRYERNDGYLEWQEASRIAEELTVEEIIERVRDLEEQRDAFTERFDTSDPATVSVFDREDHDAIHERMSAVSEWRSIERDVRLYELARRFAQNDGHILPA